MTHSLTGDRPGPFAARHIGPRPDDTRAMLAALGHDDWQPLLDSVPTGIRQHDRLDLPPARTEADVLAATEHERERPVVGGDVLGAPQQGRTPGPVGTARARPGGDEGSSEDDGGPRGDGHTLPAQGRDQFDREVVDPGPVDQLVDPGARRQPFGP